MKKIISLMLAVILLSFALTGCAFRFIGEEVDLYTVAINNVFGASGYMSNGEVSFSPYIEIIETDDFGRVMFFYDEGHLNRFGTAMIIMQKNEDGFVYYYQDVCLIQIVNDDFYDYEEINYSEIFSDEQIESLKEANDWNKPLDEAKFTKSEIVDRKNEEGTLGLEREDFDKAIEPYVVEQGYKGRDSNSISRFFVHCNTDKYGREIYYVYGVGFDVKGDGISPESEHITYDFAMIFNPDKSCPLENIYEITDPAECYEAIKQLKENCGWDKPFN